MKIKRNVVLLGIYFVVGFYNLVLTSTIKKKDIQIIEGENRASDSNYKKFTCDTPTILDCPCHRTNATVLCCQVHQPSLSVCSHDPLCSAKEILILNSDLESSIISDAIFMDFGICTENLQILRIRNSKIKYVTFSGLKSLEVLDIRSNFVGGFKEPLFTNIQSLYLSGETFRHVFVKFLTFPPFQGNNWPCLDPSSKKWSRSRSSLGFGLQMSWLLTEKWKRVWVDQNITFCGNAKQNIPEIQMKQKLPVTQGLTTFLKFTQVCCLF
jgi:hypothetical protein